VQPTGLVCRRDQFLHSRFDDRSPARVEHFNLGLADVNASDLVAHMSEARRAHRAHITQPEQTDRRTHNALPLENGQIQPLKINPNMQQFAFLFVRLLELLPTLFAYTYSHLGRNDRPACKILHT